MTNTNFSKFPMSHRNWRPNDASLAALTEFITTPGMELHCIIAEMTVAFLARGRGLLGNKTPLLSYDAEGSVMFHTAGSPVHWAMKYCADLANYLLSMAGAPDKLTVHWTDSTVWYNSTPYMHAADMKLLGPLSVLALRQSINGWVA